jgi:hypothetical protein
VKLVKSGKISAEEAASYSDTPDEFALALKGIKKH